MVSNSSNSAVISFTRPEDELTLKRHAVSFILPAWNEAENIVQAIEDTVAAAKRHCSDYEIIVVDDGSTDDTAKLVQALQSVHPTLRLIRHESNRGYGEALHTGFSAGRLEYVFFTDADNQFDMDELPLLLEWADNSDVVAGYRRVRQDPKMRLLNAWLWNRLVRFLFYVPVRDIDCAFKLFRRSALANVDIESRGAMINTEIMVKLARAGWRIVEVGVTHLPRQAGEPQGARIKVITRAFAEIARMYPHLSALSLSESSSVASVQGPVPLTDGGRRNGRTEDLAYLTGRT
jgi:glycosyltransferase involved in cell wall biosynthesis